MSFTPVRTDTACRLKADAKFNAHFPKTHLKIVWNDVEK